MKNKTYKKVLLPFLPALVNIIEKWLTKMAQKGWVLCKYNGFVFVFEKKRPVNRKYFILRDTPKSSELSDILSEGVRLYSKRKSKVNKYSYFVIEIDIKKIDKNYYNCVNYRNKYYLNYFIVMAAISFAASVFMYWLGYIDAEMWNRIFVYFWLVNIHTIYHVISIILLASTGKCSSTSNTTIK